ncbi:MAG: pyruvate kinase [Acidobacteria bacterium]|nr:pyruvate kinase [Acidobacteriota bacterium]
MKPRAKIVATVGPATSDPHILKRVLEAGADVIRINLSHGSTQEHTATFARIRSVSAELGAHVPVILDLMGPRYRLGHMDEPKALERGQTVVIGPPSTGVDLPIDDLKLLEHLKVGNRFLVGDGLVELIVVSEEDGSFTAKVINGGSVSSRKGINLPDSDLPFTISSKDREDLKLAVQLEADYVAASYVGSGEDIEALRRIIRRAGGDIPLIAKLERARAIENLHGIVSAADAVMVARGDLGVEVPLHRVPVLQKQIIESGRVHGKPVIVATQMLESMVESPRPTRAESSDVANAVFDGADALMLSGETAVGRYPVEAVKTMVKIMSEAEDHRLLSRRETEVRPLAHPSEPGSLESGRRKLQDALVLADVVAAAAVSSTKSLEVRQIVAFSQGGFTARTIARYRPETPICMLTTDPRVARSVQLVWGVRPLQVDKSVEHHDQVVDLVDRELLAAKLARPGEVIVILMGVPIRDRPLTNLMRLHHVRGPD